MAPATPAGAGAVSIVRLSGPDALIVASRMTGVDPSAVAARTLVRCTVRDGRGEEIDSGLVVFFPGPGSFTGEDAAEIHLHGNPLVVERASSAACALGAAPAAPGEFSRRAFLNGKMDLTQAEALSDLIAAKTEAAARAALRQLRGGIRNAISPIREQLVSLQLLLEASIDFADDIPPASHGQLAERVSILIKQVERCADSFERGRRYRDGAAVAIAGVANVGKSLLLNRILGEERAIVTAIPGTTRDYLSGEVSLSGILVKVTDTAGLRETADPVEREGVRRSRAVISAADLVLFVLDGSREAGAADAEAYREVEERPHLLVVNKRDLRCVEDGARFAGTGRKETVPTSAKTGEGLDALLRAVAREVAPDEGAIMREAPLTRLRHRDAVRRAQEALRRALEAAGNGLPLEFVASDVRDAARALSELVGDIAPEEVLDAVFRDFCVGK